MKYFPSVYSKLMALSIATFVLLNDQRHTEVSRTTFALKHIVLGGRVSLETAVNITKIMKHSYALIKLVCHYKAYHLRFLNICLWSKELEERHKLDAKIFKNSCNCSYHLLFERVCCKNHEAEIVTK